MINNYFKTFFLPTFVLLCSLAANAKAQSVINRSLTANEKTGIIEPYKNTEVATAEMGVVREVFVKPGDVVDAGEPIGRLDNEQQKAFLFEAETDASALGMLETAMREVEFNKRRVEETAKLVAAGKGSPKELERFQLDLNIATAKMRAQQDAKQISNARLEKARLMLSERLIRAPHHGTVVEVYRDVGEYIAGNAPAIIRLIDTSKLRARFYLSDEIAEKFRKTNSAEVRLSNHVVVKAVIEFLAPFANGDGHVIDMTVLIENENGLIRSSKCELVLP